MVGEGIRNWDYLWFYIGGDDVISQSNGLSETTGWMAKMMGNPKLTFCFLLPRYMKSIRPFPVTYPMHQLWNAYSPFEEITGIEIANIKEIKYKT